MKLLEHLQISRRAMGMLLRLNRTYVFCIVGSALLKALTPYIPIYFSARLLDALIAGAPVSALLLYAGLTVGLTFLLTTLRQWADSLSMKAQEDAIRSMEWMFSEKTMSMAYASTEDRETKRLLEQIRKETMTGFNLFNLITGIQQIVSALAQILASIGLCASFFTLSAISAGAKAGLLLLVLLTVVCSTLAASKSAKIQMEFYSSCVDINVLEEKFEQYISDYSAGKDIRLYAMTDMVAQASADANLKFWQGAFQTQKKVSLLSLPKAFLQVVLQFFVYLILIRAALVGAVSVGSIAKYVSCLALLIQNVCQLIATLQMITVNHYYLKRFFSYFDIPNNMYQGTLTTEKRDDNEYLVEFRDVSFRYPNTQSYALRHVNLTFKVGEKLAVVGKNGSGKTTFIKLLCRLYDPTEGQILLNGVDIRKYDYDEYLSLFSVVFQDFQLLSLTLGQNVAAAKSWREEDVLRCLKKAGMDSRLERMPKGTETYLYRDYSPDGVEISGGEAQKIALARALYKDAPFVLLDEPTAALDPVSEYQVYAGFNQIAGEKTSVYISHRLASCRFCDQIAVFDGGELVQTGSHETLLSEEGGVYSTLWYAQAQYYTESHG